MKRNKSIFIPFSLLPWALSAAPLWAGMVSFTLQDIQRLQYVVKHSPEAARWAGEAEKRADAALQEDPRPIARIQTAGNLQGSAEKTATQEALKDMGRMRDLEWAYALTGRDSYRDKAARFVLAWVRTCQPPPNPIDATNLEPLLECYDLVRPSMAPGDSKKADDWVRSVAQTLLASDNPDKGTYWNNWKAHRLKIVALCAFIVGDQVLEEQTLEAFKTFLGKNLNPDGTTLDFLERDALHYQVYDLEPMIRTAILFERARGLDLYHFKTSRGASIDQCVAFVIPYAEGTQTHAEYVHTNVPFDRQRAQNHEKGHGIGEPFDPQAALKCLELAQFFEGEMVQTITKLKGEIQTGYPTLQVLLNEVQRPQRMYP